VTREEGQRAGRKKSQNVSYLDWHRGGRGGGKDWEVGSNANLQGVKALPLQTGPERTGAKGKRVEKQGAAIEKTGGLARVGGKSLGRRKKDLPESGLKERLQVGWDMDNS